MKIIKLGYFNIQFCCSECHTIFEVSTEELLAEKDEHKQTVYYVNCPVCGNFIKVGFGKDSAINKLLKFKSEENKDE